MPTSESKGTAFGLHNMKCFAYGSNLCFPRLTSRVPSAKFLSVAKLPGHRVTFHKKSIDGSGKATLVDAVDSEVFGALFEFEQEDLSALRAAEGYSKHYREEEVGVFTLDGSVSAMTYIANDAYYDSSQVPYGWYVDLIRCGARQVGIPDFYIAQFVSVICKADKDAARVRRERAFLG